MIFIVYAESKQDSISSSLGLDDYSYYFVMQQFSLVLERIGPVIRVEDVYQDVDAIFHWAARFGERCIFFSFTPPHKTASDLRCPTIPVFAWEYDTIPYEAWGGNSKNNWAAELLNYGVAVVHSAHTSAAVRSATRSDFPAVSIPAPLWDEFNGYYEEKAQPALENFVEIFVNGWVIDSRDYTAGLANEGRPASLTKVQLEGIVYTAVFNPDDARKNWHDFLDAFCWAFRNERNAVLILKLTHSDPSFCFGEVAGELPKLMPFDCRVVIVQGYLSSEDYSALIHASHFVVNSAFGEGQCLPLMEFMSAGKPSIAPDHTGMADYVNESNSFVVASSNEWFHWPHDPRLVLRTFRRRINWESLVLAFERSFEEVIQDPVAYRNRSIRAVRDLQSHCSRDVAINRIGKVIAIAEALNEDAYSGYRQKLMRPIYRCIWSIGGKLKINAVAQKILLRIFMAYRGSNRNQ